MQRPLIGVNHRAVVWGRKVDTGSLRHKTRFGWEKTAVRFTLGSDPMADWLVSSENSIIEASNETKSKLFTADGLPYEIV